MVVRELTSWKQHTAFSHTLEPASGFFHWDWVIFPFMLLSLSRTYDQILNIIVLALLSSSHFPPNFLAILDHLPTWSYLTSYTSYLTSPRIPFWYFYWDHMKLIGSLPLTALWRQESENMVYFSIVKLLCPLVALKLQTINLTYFLISSIQEGFFLAVLNWIFPLS